MVVVLQAGFDDLSATQFTNDGWSANPSSVNAGTPDGNALRLTNASTGTLLSHALPSSYSTAIGGCKVNLRGAAGVLPNTTTFFYFFHGATQICAIAAVLVSSTTFNFRIVNAAGTTVATGTTAFSSLADYYVEMKCVVGTSGTVELKVDGAVEIAATTSNYGSTNIDTVGIRNNNSNGATATQVDFDDLYVLDTANSPDTTYLADATHVPHVQTLFPDGDGAHSDFTPNSGVTHYTQVDEATPNDDTDYVSSATATNRDSYTFDNLSSLVSVNRVVARLWARKDDAGTRQIAAVARPTSTDRDGATQSIISTYAMYNEAWVTNPDGSSAWTTSDVNGAEFGIKLVT